MGVYLSDKKSKVLTSVLRISRSYLQKRAIRGMSSREGEGEGGYTS